MIGRCHVFVYIIITLGKTINNNEFTYYYILPNKRENKKQPPKEI